MNPLPDRTFVLRSKWLLPNAATVLDGGWVQVVRGRVVGCGTGTPPRPACDLGDAILAPGFVNPHTHLEFSLLDRPIEPGDGGLIDWIRQIVARRRGDGGGLLTDPAAAILAGLAESVSAGVTSLGEIATHAFDPPRPAWSPRVRAFQECLGLRRAEPRGAPSVAERAVRRRIARSMVAGRAAGISPHAPYSVRSDLARRLVAFAAENGLPATVHLAESEGEAEFLETRRGPWRSLLEELGAWPEEDPPLLSSADWITLLSRLRRAAIVHGTFLDESATARLIHHRRRVALIVCPRTARRLAGEAIGRRGGVPSLARRLKDLRRAGVRVALGTDGRGSSPDLSVRMEASAAVEMGLVSPREAFGMITADAAWAIGFDGVAGSITVGRPADLAVVGSSGGDDAIASLVDPASRPLATYRAGRLIWPRPAAEGDESLRDGSCRSSSR